MDLDQAHRFLRILDPSADARELLDGIPNGFTFQCFDDVKARKSPSLARIIHGTLDDKAATLFRFNAQKAGVFVTINETDMKGRKIPNLTRVRAVWIEDDHGNSPETPIPPHLITETSPGKFHKIFLVDGLTPEQHLGVQNTLVSHYGSDPCVIDLVRVLRVPGFYHNKGEPFMVRLLFESDRRPYTAEELLAAFPISTSAEPKAKKKESGIVEEGYTPITEDYILPDVTLENAESFLPSPGEQNYAEWRDVGAALHHQFNGSEGGLEIFDRWSQNVREYQGYDDVAKQWSAFGKRTGGKVVTFKTIMQAYYKRTAEQRVSVDLSAMEKAHRLLDECDDYMHLMRNVAPKLWRLSNKNVVLEKDFQAALINRYATLRPGETLTKPEALRALKMKHESKKPRADASLDLESETTPAWAKNWVWVSGDEKFFNVKTRVSLSSAGFRGHFNSCLPTGDDAPKDAAEYLRVNNLIPKVMKTLYAPNFSALFEYAGVQYVNTYNADFRTTVPDEIVNPAYVEAFKLHLTNLCGGWNREAQLLANFLAACTADIPLKVRWAPLLIGAPGNGKSLLHTLVSSAIGLANTKVVPNSVIANSAVSGQSGWAEGHCLGAIEEVKMHGHNRYDIFNNLKPYITNDVVPCRKLYEEVRNIPNTANWLLFSNYQGGAPIEDGDRRFFVIISGFKPPEGEKYFKILQEAISLGAGDIVRWLRDLPLHADFNPDGHAPMTEDKKTVIRLTGDDLAERILEVMEDDNNPYYGPSAVLFDSLYVRLSSGYPGLKLESTYKLTATLSGMGFSNLGRVRIEGERHSLWCRSTDGTTPTQKWGKKIIEDRIASKTGDDLL